MNINIQWHGCTFTICHDGSRFVAICSKGHDKKRMDRNVWLNVFDGSRVSDALTTALEQGVSDYQRANAVTPRPGQPGQRPALNLNSERRERGPTRREWRGREKE
jgi:hypothetical protein